MKLPHKNWNESEIERAIALYIETPFGRLHAKNPDVIRLANELDRTPGAVALKLTNLASIDETIDRKGMANASKLDRAVWGRFFEGLHNAAESSDDQANKLTVGSFMENPQARYTPNVSAGSTTERITNVRNGQTTFRKMILANYDLRCAITGISQTELLVAGHIRPWAEDLDNRMNPSNGICLNRLHDKAFEDRFIAIEDDGRVLYSSRLKTDTREKLLQLSDGGRFRQPSKFLPDKDFLAEHRDQFHFLEKTS